MNKTEAANLLHDQGYSCSQSVLAPFAEELGITKETALKITSAFGGGMGRTGNTCGAVSGAVMAIGLKFGTKEVISADEKTELYNKVSDFLKEFKSIHMHTQCKDLLGYDISKPDEFAIVKENEISKNKCPGFITSAVEILENMFRV